MKKLLSLAAVSLAFAATADYYSPRIGVQKFVSAVDNFILPVRFDSLNQSAISAKELVCTNGLTEGTALYVFHPDSTNYTSWVLGPSGWEAAARVSDTELRPSAPNENEKLVSGSAIWITPANGKTFSIYGKVLAATNSTIVANRTNLLANPTGAPVSGSDLKTKLSAVANKKDTVTMIGTSYSGYYSYAGDEKWTYVNTDNTGTTKATPNADFPELAANQGFWYVSKTAGVDATINW